MPTTSQLLFSSAKRRLDPYDTEVLVARIVGHLLQALQNDLVVTERLRSLTDAQAKANVRLGELQAAVNKAEEEKKAELGKLKKELTRKAEEREKELSPQVEELRKELAEEQRLKQEALEESKDVEAKVTIFVRAQVSHQFLIQKLPEAHFRGYIDSYLQIGSMSNLGPTYSLALDVDVGEGSSRKGDEDVGDNADA